MYLSCPCATVSGRRCISPSLSVTHPRVHVDMNTSAAAVLPGVDDAHAQRDVRGQSCAALAALFWGEWQQYRRIFQGAWLWSNRSGNCWALLVVAVCCSVDLQHKVFAASLGTFQGSFDKHLGSSDEFYGSFGRWYGIYDDWPIAHWHFETHCLCRLQIWLFSTGPFYTHHRCISNVHVCKQSQSHTHTHTQTRARAHIHTHTNTHTNTLSFARKHTHTHTNAHTHTHTHAHTHIKHVQVLKWIAQKLNSLELKPPAPNPLKLLGQETLSCSEEEDEVPMYITLSMYIHLNMNVYTYIYILVDIHVYICIYMYIHMYIYRWINVYV